METLGYFMATAFGIVTGIGLAVLFLIGLFLLGAFVIDTFRYLFK